MTYNDLWTLAPSDAARRVGVRARAHNAYGTVIMRALVDGREKARWYMGPDDAEVVTDALEEAGRVAEAAEFRKAVAAAREECARD